MKRRTFLSMVAGLTLVPGLLFAQTNLMYTDGLIQKHLDEGKSVFVDYAADWCGTCRLQGQLISQLRERNPEYDKNIVFVTVDWDSYSTHDVTSSRNVPRRSTLLMLKGEEELGRIVAGIDINEIKELLDKGLN
ncbi:thioredoxin family protein [Leucothrix pacifica]|uniref:Thioredoxin n=1 Tax=Leucothrix pacifica TaxID=1247513 RepID=A0A317CU29_9GAMM|nr:thioredoxin family protein [Leucothrix pacifica]PWQ99832.1 thioredoxin [Leucothrix pacifica]